MNNNDLLLKYMDFLFVWFKRLINILQKPFFFFFYLSNKYNLKYKKR